ncbi:hypothetical protein WJX72_010888 [[Myrmecia] bisecta]|uniref:Uncharacterized protein n=1 Tax=[Myrmecia] bisecta TaxID=41462 RepID=A0AAW1PYT6_9CHLO
MTESPEENILRLKRESVRNCGRQSPQRRISCRSAFVACKKPGGVKTIFIAEVEEGVVVNPVAWEFENQRSFDQYLDRCMTTGLLDVTEGMRGPPVNRYDKLIEGHLYVEKATDSVLQEFKHAWDLHNPVIRNDLRLLPNIERDAVGFGQHGRAIIAEHKRYTKGKAALEKWCERMRVLRHCIKDHQAVKGRRLGLAVMPEYIDPKARSSVPNFCRKHDKALFRRSGRALQIVQPGGQGIVHFA